MPITTGRAGRATPRALYRENGPLGGAKVPAYRARPFVNLSSPIRQCMNRRKPKLEFRRPTFS
jgi:hypothetical protein